MTPKPARRTALVLICVLGAGALVGIVAGTTLALWRDEASFTGEISMGTVGFAVERADRTGSRSVSTGPDDAVGITIGAAEAHALTSDGAVAVPVRVDALAQGQLGLRYEIHLPQFEEGSILGAAEMVMVPVDGPTACTSPSRPLPPQPPLAAVPVPAQYSDTTVPTTEYWCLMAALEQAPVVGSYISTGTVSGQWAGGTVEASDEWVARVTPDPAHERDATITFVHQTLRAG